MGDSSAQYRGHRSKSDASTGATALRVVVLTVVSAAIVLVAVLRLSDDRSAVAAFDAAPTCPAGTSAAAARTADCKLVTEYSVTFADQQGSGRDWKAFIGLSAASGAARPYQFASPGNEYGFADPGDKVNLTTWHGVPIQVANGILDAELVNPLLESGDGPYLWIWYTVAAYLFLLPLLLARGRLPLPLLLIAPTAVLALGLTVHDSVVGGDWRHCVLYIGLVVIALAYLVLGAGRLKPVRALLGRV
jgi:hypothetical protein